MVAQVRALTQEIVQVCEALAHLDPEVARFMQDRKVDAKLNGDLIANKAKKVGKETQRVIRHKQVVKACRELDIPSCNPGVRIPLEVARTGLRRRISGCLSNDNSNIESTPQYKAAMEAYEVIADYNATDPYM